ncbi:MAG: IS1634 family transposase [Bacteroidetes bacterium]|nr:IS1634 family transposase [Bacteroidota bacterium]
MFIRQKKNQSGSISVQIISKSSGKYKVVETIGCSKNDYEIEQLLKQANDRLLELEPNLFDFVEYQNKKQTLTNKDMRVIGDELIFGKLFKDIGCLNIPFTKTQNLELFKALVISRLLYPGSKLYLIDYYNIYKKQKIDKNKIYRFMDTIYQDDLKLKIEKCVFTHTKQIMDDTITVTFYDVTTLYFESESEDDFRRIGFSKEGKLARPQIQLGLFTTLQGYPLSYEVYEGNKYEGHTLVDILQKFQEKFNIKTKPIVVADRGMLNNDNIAYLENNNYKYIIAAKIKNISNELKEQISNLTFINDGTIHTIEMQKEIKYKDKDDNQKTLNTKQRLILTYSSKRAKKDKYTREQALKKIETKLSKNITKSDLKLSYYAKYLDIDEKCNIKYKLNLSKISNDEKLDGIKGFITNDFTLSPNEVIKHYQNQYDVEKAFRISKTDLKIRPIYHRLETRIKAHILISFVSYAVYKEFERKIKQSNLDIKFKLTFDHIKTMYGYKTLYGIEPLQMDEIQQKIYDAVYDK